MKISNFAMPTLRIGLCLFHAKMSLSQLDIRGKYKEDLPGGVAAHLDEC